METDEGETVIAKTEDLDDADRDADEQSVDDIERELDIALARFFSSCNVPPKEVENKYFLAFNKLLCCGIDFRYRPPARHTFAGSVLKSVNDDCEEEKRRELSDCNIVLMINTWTNEPAKKEHLIFTLTNEVIPRTFLSFKNITLERESIESLRIMIQEAIDLAWSSYQAKVSGIVVDDDEKLVGAADLAKTIDGDKLFVTTCVSSSAKLLIKSLVDDEQLIKIKDVVNFFKSPRIESSLLEEGGTKLQNYSETRFFYLSKSCQSIHANLHILRALCQKIDPSEEKSVKNVVKILNDPEFEMWVQEIVQFIDPICDLIKTCQDPKSMVADVVPLWRSLRLPENFYQHEIQQIMKTGDERGTSQVAYLAYSLHPQYEKRTPLNDDQLGMVNDYLARYFPEAFSEFDSYLKHKGDDSRIREKLIASCDPLAFWRLIDYRYPNLSKCALKIMLLPASTALSEELFSSCTNVHHVFRNRILDGKANHLLNIHFSLKENVAPCDENGFPLE